MPAFAIRDYNRSTYWPLRDFQAAAIADASAGHNTASVSRAARRRRKLLLAFASPMVSKYDNTLAVKTLIVPFY